MQFECYRLKSRLILGFCERCHDFVGASKIYANVLMARRVHHCMAASCGEDAIPNPPELKKPCAGDNIGSKKIEAA